jgi:hypothetical protein
MPQSGKQIETVARFGFDYTFYLNLFFIAVAAGLVWLHRSHVRKAGSGMKHDMDHGIGPKRVIALLFLVLQLGGLVAFIVSRE